MNTAENIRASSDTSIISVCEDTYVILPCFARWVYTVLSYEFGTVPSLFCADLLQPSSRRPRRPSSLISIPPLRLTTPRRSLKAPPPTPSTAQHSPTYVKEVYKFAHAPPFPDRKLGYGRSDRRDAIRSTRRRRSRPCDYPGRDFKVCMGAAVSCARAS